MGGPERHKGRVTILGCGGSGGVPLIGNYWGLCDPQEPKNKRTRASIHVEIDGFHLQVDTGPDFRAQLNANNINRVDAVLYTHEHSDHTNGIDDLRYMAITMQEMIDVYADQETMDELLSRFSYLFIQKSELYKPWLIRNIIKRSQDIDFEKDIPDFKVFEQYHGQGKSIGIRCGDFAYSTDVSEFPAESLEVLKGVKVWILDCGQYGQDFIEIHPNFDKVKSWNDIVCAERVILTHLPVKVDFKDVQSALPSGYELAYDGLTFDFNPKS